MRDPAEWVGFARMVAAERCRREPAWADRDAIHGDAMLGLLDACAKADGERSDSEWMNYLRRRVSGAIADGVRARGWASRADVARAAATGTPIATLRRRPPEWMPDPGVPDRTGDVDTAILVRDAVARLDDVDRRLIEALWFDEIPARVYAEQLGVTESRVSQLHKRARARLRIILD